MTGPRTLLGIGKEAEVFDADGLALKLYRRGGAKAAAFREAAHLAQVETLGLPAPQVLSVACIDDRWGLIMSRATGGPLARRMQDDPARLSAFLSVMVDLQRRIHACSGSGFASLKARLAHNIRVAKVLEKALRARLLDRLARLPDGDRLCHGDFHPFNILGSMDEPVVVDWLDAASGPPAADVCRSYVLMHGRAFDFASAYVAAYAEASGMAEDEIRAWVPVIAAARLSEGVPEEEQNLLALAEQV